MKLNPLIYILMTAPIIANAGVYPQNGDYYVSFEDISMAKNGHELNLKRTYNSLASGVGWFGFGWNSLFETRLDVMPDGSAVIQENGLGHIDYYRPQAKQNVEEGVAKIVSVIALKNGLSTDEAEALKNKLVSNEEERLHKVRQFEIKTDLAVGTVLSNSDCPIAQLERMSTGYKRMGCDHHIDYFDLSGHLVRVQTADGYSRSLVYENNHPTKIQDSEGQHIDLKWSESNLLSEAKDDKYTYQYLYDANKNLTKLSVSSGNAYEYSYDTNHNLTKIGYLDSTAQFINYVSPSSGKVSSTSERRGEKATYEYGTDPQDPLHYWTIVTKYDAKGVAGFPEKFEFHDVKTVTGDTKVAEFNQSGGFTNNSIQLDQKGRVTRQISSNGTVSEFSYDESTGKISKVTKGNQVTEFQYDPNGELTKATRSDGRIISIDYNDKKLIKRAVFTSQHNDLRKEMTFKYDKLSHPNKIILVGVGEIDVEYDSKGEITKVNSKQGAKMGLEVTLFFQELLAMTKITGVGF